MKRMIASVLALLLTSFLSSSANAWHDKTHIAVGKAAGFDLADYLAAPDIAKLKANNVEAYNHFVNNEEKGLITPELVKSQIGKYNLGIVDEQKGHLYGAIVAAIRTYKDEAGAGKYGVYNLVYVGHYIGDLSMPLHNIAYDKFNAEHHGSNDGIVEDEVLSHLDQIKTYPITIKTEDDLIQNIVKIATKAKDLGYTMEKENRDMKKEEAYGQLSDSASLFKAVLEYANYSTQTPKQNNGVQPVGPREGGGMTAQQLIMMLLVGGILGAVGQGIRVIVGVKKLYDQALHDQKPFSDYFAGSTLLFSLLIGFVAGVLGIIGLGGFAAMQLGKEQILALIGIGYAGADFIEGFIKKNLPDLNGGTPKGGQAASDSPKTAGTGQAATVG